MGNGFVACFVAVALGVAISDCGSAAAERGPATIRNEHLRVTFGAKRKSLTELVGGPAGRNYVRPGSALLVVNEVPLTKFERVSARASGQGLVVSFSDGKAGVRGTVEVTLEPGDRHVTAVAKVTNAERARQLKVVFPDLAFAFARKDSWCFEPLHTGRLRPLAEPHYAKHVNPIRRLHDPKKGGFWVYGYEGAEQIPMPGTALIDARGNIGVAALDWNHFTMPFGVESVGEVTRVWFVQNRPDYTFDAGEERSFGCVVGSDERDWHFSLRPYRDWLVKTYGLKPRPSWWKELDGTIVNNAYFGLLFHRRLEGVDPKNQRKVQPQPHKVVHTGGLVPVGGKYEDALPKLPPNVERTNARILLFHQWWDAQEQGPMYTYKKGPLPAAGGYHAERTAGGYESLGKLLLGLQKLGLHCMPYFHSITFRKQGPYGLEWSEATVVKDADGEPVLCSGQPTGLLGRQSHEPFFFRWLPCPGEPRWVDFLCERARDVMSKSHADCLCYDQVGAARHSTCFNPLHKHRFPDEWGAGRLKLCKALAQNALKANPDVYIYVELLHMKRHCFHDTCAVHQQDVEVEESWKSDWDRGHTRAINPHVQICYSPKTLEAADAALVSGLGYNEYRRPWSHQRANSYVRELFLEAFLDDVAIAPSMGDFEADMRIVHRHFRGDGRELLAFLSPFADWRGTVGVWVGEAADPALVEYPSGKVVAPRRKAGSRVYFPIALAQKRPHFWVLERQLLRGIELKGRDVHTAANRPTKSKVQITFALASDRDCEVAWEVRIPGGFKRHKGTWRLKRGENKVAAEVTPQPVVCPGERTAALRLSRGAAHRCYFFPVELGTSAP
jgi:hypothetical protein